MAASCLNKLLLAGLPLLLLSVRAGGSSGRARCRSAGASSGCELLPGGCALTAGSAVAAAQGCPLRGCTAGRLPPQHSELTAHPHLFGCRRAVGFAFPAFASSLVSIKSILLFNRAGIRDTEVTGQGLCACICMSARLQAGRTPAGIGGLRAASQRPPAARNPRLQLPANQVCLPSS